MVEAGVAVVERDAAVESLVNLDFGTRKAEAARAVRWSAAFAERAEAFATEPTAEGLAVERKALLLDEFFTEMVIVAAGIAGAGQLQDAGARAFGQTVVAGAAAADVCQSRCAAFP
jgi:hypothetical protein